jgi:large subunit ribosomal protein L21
MYAVIQTGGKQYRVKEGDLVSVEKLDAGNGPKIDFTRVLLIEDGETILVGTPALEKALVRAEVIETYKDDKVLVFKKKKTKQFRRTRGHRQQLTKVRVEGIYPDASAAPALETVAAKPAAARKKAPEAKAKAEAAAPAHVPEKKAEPEAAKAAAKPRKPAKAAREKAAPKAKTPVRKTASAKPAAKAKKKTKE